MLSLQSHPASYRDPSGFIFEKDGVIYRQVNQSYKEDFELFDASGCLNHFIEKGVLVNVQQVKENLTGTENWYTTLLPEQLSFISYPYEWSFDMLKDAALLTLQLAKEAIPFGMILKDATPYNIQWHKRRMIFIDTLSFEKYDDSKPWIAYRQFCECFLGPLLLMHYSKQHLQNLLLAYPEGIPLSITKSLLPFRSWFSFFTYLHIHLHEKLTRPGKPTPKQSATFSKTKMLNLLNSLEVIIKKLKAPVQKTNWSEYYEEAGLRGDYIQQKEKIIQGWLSELPGLKTAIDLGANDGYFSQLPAAKNIYTIAAEADANCINNLYIQSKQKATASIHPLILDLANPTPAIGVNNKERSSFLHRAKVDLAMALALIHHLSVGKNMSFDQCADLFSSVTGKLIIEFVPKEDEKVQLLLLHKKDIYPSYTIEEFEQAFSKYFNIEKKQIIPGTQRVLYLMNKL
jgi:hypothetical protein